MGSCQETTSESDDKRYAWDPRQGLIVDSHLLGFDKAYYSSTSTAACNKTEITKGKELQQMATPARL